MSAPIEPILDNTYEEKTKNEGGTNRSQPRPYLAKK